MGQVRSNSNHAYPNLKAMVVRLVGPVLAVMLAITECGEKYAVHMDTKKDTLELVLAEPVARRTEEAAIGQQAGRGGVVTLP